MNKTRSTRNTLFDLLVLSGIEVFMMTYLDVRYLFLDTIVTGGDTASWYGIADHFMRVLLPQGRLTGWDMGNFCGYPNFSFYFIPPFLLAAVTSFLFPVPLTIALKCVIVLGIFLLPVTTYLGLRAMDYRFPVPAVGASASLLFLFNETYTMFGGNILSTLTGEFCYMIAFALFAYFIGSLYKGVNTGTGAIKNGIFLGLIGLIHLFVFIPAVCLLIYWFLAKGKLNYLSRVSMIAFGLMAFWILPLLAYRDPFTTPVYMIWQPFVSWRYAFMGLGIALPFIGPRLALAGLSSMKKLRQLAIPLFSSVAVFTLCYLLFCYLVLGKGLWDTGLEITPLSSSPLGPVLALRLEPLVIPFSVAGAALVMVLGIRSISQPAAYLRFCTHTGAISSLGLLIASFLGLYYLVCTTLPSARLRAFLLDPAAMAFLALGIAGAFVFFYRKTTAFLLRTAQGLGNDRFRMFLGLSFGCVVGYFSAHFLEVPDIRFLPPLLFVLLLVLFADTLDTLLSGTPTAPSSSTSHRRKGRWAVAITYLCLLAVIFGATRADVWFRFNNRGYDLLPGYSEFQELNKYLREAYSSRGLDPLNSPRVAYEKSGLYGRYGGDRIFESLSFFSGRQTLEGIHYASSVASRFIAFLQTAYSLEIKTPRSYILSRMNPDSLPAYFDLYNISQLILISDEAKKTVGSSPWFEKEKDFGPLTVFRYKRCDGLFVDVPKHLPVLYTGKDWVEDFVLLYKEARALEMQMIPAAYIMNTADRMAFPATASKVTELKAIVTKQIDRQGLHIETRLEQGSVHFTTNRVGLPHVVKVSYFPNWKVQGAHGVYPVSPHLMVVVPREQEVVLTYGRTFWDKAGTVITMGTMLFLFLTVLLRVGRRRRSGWNGNPPLIPPLIKGGDEGGRIRPLLIALVLLAAAGLIAGGAHLRNRPVRAYVDGYKLYERGNHFFALKNTEAARAAFQASIEAMAPIVAERRQYDHQDVIHCMLFTAMAFEKLGEPVKAEDLYTAILKQYPYSRYLGEAYVKLGRLKKLGRNEDLEAGLRALQQDQNQRGLETVRKALAQTKACLDFLTKAIKEDPCSVWAGYAKQDLAAEQVYIENKRPLIRAVAHDQEIERMLSDVLEQTVS
jgi:hypothetical protein